jgi:CTP synthase
MESVPFLEAARQLIHEFGRQNAISVHVTLVPSVSGGEIKTKPTQHAVKELQEVGIQPDVVVLRSKEPLEEGIRRKISSFTNVEFEGVISGYDVPTIYEVPLVYYQSGIDAFILKKMNVESRHADLSAWKQVVDKVMKPASRVRIGVVGKYMELHDAYKSVWEALGHVWASSSIPSSSRGLRRLIPFSRHSSPNVSRQPIPGLLAKTIAAGGIDRGPAPQFPQFWREA